jgi:NAD(P)-dependent dehydrogenase (short-subunit alcohol dehydrogenase family)
MDTAPPTMAGKICLVTGASSGIGKATALGLAAQGATVLMVSRDRAHGEAAQQEIQAQSDAATVDLLLADLSSQAAIRELAATMQQRYGQLHVLINNAGGLYMTRRETGDRLEMTLAVNYLAPFLLTNLLRDLLVASAPARIINVSSAVHESASFRPRDLQSRKRYGPMRAYGQAKFAVVLFTYALARRLAGTGVTANCLHPGFVATNFAQGGLPAPLRWAVRQLYRRFAISPEEGAQTSLYLATDPAVAAVSGRYYVQCRPHRSAPQTYDVLLQDQLWAASARLVHEDGKKARAS